MTSFSQATLLLNSSEIAKPAFNKAAVCRGRRNCARATITWRSVLYSANGHRLASFPEDRAEPCGKGREGKGNREKCCDFAEDSFYGVARGGWASPRDEQTLSACLSLRHVAFANFNEPEWLAAADSTFLWARHGAAEIAPRRVAGFLADGRSLRAYGLPGFAPASMSNATNQSKKRRGSRGFLPRDVSPLPPTFPCDAVALLVNWYKKRKKKKKKRISFATSAGWKKTSRIYCRTLPKFGVR